MSCRAAGCRAADLELDRAQLESSVRKEKEIKDPTASTDTVALVSDVIITISLSIEGTRVSALTTIEG